MTSCAGSNKLKNKVAIVTGAAQGIGMAIASVFAREGADLVLLDVNERLLKSVGSRLPESMSGRLSWHGADITDAAAVNKIVETSIQEFGAIDVLVNNAGINVFSDPLSLDMSDWNRCMSTNLEGAWNCARAVLPTMIGNGSGSIVNIASVHGHKIIPGAFPYSVAKHALLGLTKALAIEYAASGVRVNSISPGLIDTPIADAYFNSQENPEDSKAELVALIPAKRIGGADEVANTALFLASDDARFINAADILIDGGRCQLYHE